jgi:hypothetical protein
MMLVLHIAALLGGIVLVAGGSIFWFLALMFGHGGWSSAYRRDYVAEVVAIAAAIAGFALLAWAVLS